MDRPKLVGSDIARLLKCKNVFGWLIFLYALAFYLPVILLLIFGVLGRSSAGQ
jgi:hypothetical protein